MKRLAVLALLLAACGDICPGDKTYSRPLQTGDYTLAQMFGECGDGKPSSAVSDEEQHRLSVAADQKTVTETWVRNGKTYVVTYDVVQTSHVTQAYGFTPGNL